MKISQLIHSYPLITSAVIGAVIATGYPESSWQAAAVVVVAHTLAMKTICRLANVMSLSKNVPRPLIFLAKVATHIRVMQLFRSAAWAIGPYAPALSALYFRSRPMQVLPPTLLTLGVIHVFA